MLVVNSVLKDNERNDSMQQDNEMDSQVEKDHLEEGELGEVEGGRDEKPPYKPEYQYSREELLKYLNSPFSTQRPVVNDPAVDGLFCWIGTRSTWNNYKRSDTPTERGDDSYKRRPNDPRERVRKEQDGIVLSPQRRSFNSGCFVTVAPNTAARPQAEPAKEGPVRRIGSGRILNRDWEYRDKENNDDGFSFRPSVGPSPRERDERYDMRRNYSGLSMERELVRDVSRESLSREKELRADPRARERDRMQRYPGDRRRYEAEEPEWFSGPPGPPLYGYCEVPVPPVVRRGPNFHVLRTVAWSPLQLPLPRPFRPPRLCVPYVKTFGGPTSQHDTIELRGFEDANDLPRSKPKTISKNSSKPNSRDSKSNTGSRKSSSEEISVQKTGAGAKDIEPDPPAATSSPKVEPRDSPKVEPETSAMEEAERGENHEFNLNLEDFLQLDSLPLLTNGGGGEGNQSGSRFSQWFRRDSPPENETRRSSIQDELIKNIINDISEPSINIPIMKESDAYFAPISPAGTTSGNSLLEMLQGSHQQNEHRGQAPSIKDLEATGKVTNVEELEARMRQGAGQSPISQSSQGHSKKGTSNKKEEELIAFKKLLKQVVEGGAIAGSVKDPLARPPMLSQMLNKPPELSDMMGQAQPPNAGPPMHVPQDLVYKLLHVQEQQRQAQQQQEINKLLFSSGRLAPPQVHGALSPLPPELQVLVANSQPSPELLARPEAQAILQGLRQGEITPQHLIQQLQNPAMQPRHREVLASILKLHGGSPRPASPLMVPPDPALIQQLMLQQQLRIPSPLPPMHNAFCQSSMISPNPLGTSPNTLTVQHTGLPHRVPSPRELMLHTQNIMQSALIKKKLEEQRENYRKRQEMQRATSPNVAAGAKSPNPAAANSNNNAPNNNSTSTPSANMNNNNNNNNNATTTPNSSSNSNTTATKSPTPLAFTPTSVLRKMTAEQQPQPKDGDGNKNKYNELIQAQAKLQRQNELLKIQAAQAAQSSRLYNNQLLGLRSPQQQWSMTKQPIQQPLQQGRAIVKGSGSYAPAPPPGTGLADLPYGNNARAAYPQRSKLTMAAAPMVQPNLYNSYPTSANRGPPNRGYPPQMGPLPQHNINVNPALQQLLMSQSMTSAHQRNVFKPDIRNSFHQFIPGSGGDGDLSTSPTTSNQLAHWFTPELLAQAQAQTRSGKTDSTLNMVSVEELERLQQNSAPVLN